MTMQNERYWGQARVAMETERQDTHTSPSFCILICKMTMVLLTTRNFVAHSRPLFDTRQELIAARIN